MTGKFKSWKEKGTREAILFYVALALFAYWGIRKDFNVNELYLGAVVYILTGFYIFTGSRKRNGDDDPPKGEELVLESKQNAERPPTDSTSTSRIRIFWSSSRGYSVCSKFKSRYLYG